MNKPREESGRRDRPERDRKPRAEPDDELEREAKPDRIGQKLGDNPPSE